MQKERIYSKKNHLNFGSSSLLTSDCHHNLEDILNHELISLDALSKIIKSYQMEFLSSKNENDYDFIINSLNNFKNNLYHSLLCQVEERNFILTKVNFIFFIY